ncbi:MAG: hypothetical protein ACTSSG_07250 [Candidatus Heimdallarchaeaceae archaeon]
MQLPLTFEVSVSSYKRITIPKWISFIETKDVVEGFIQLIKPDDPKHDYHSPIKTEKRYYFSRQVAQNRMISLGALRYSLPNKKFTPRLLVTIENVKKAISTDLCFNLVSYIYQDGEFLLNYETIQLKPTVQFFLDSLAERVLEGLFQANMSKKSSILKDSYYLDDDKIWIIPIENQTFDEMGGKVPLLLFLILNQECYEKYIQNQEEVLHLFKRFNIWLLDRVEFNKANLANLSSQLQNIIVLGIEPEYYSAAEILRMKEPRGQIIQIVIKEHENRGIKVKKLAEVLRRDPTEIQKIVDELAKEGLVIKFVQNGEEVVDSSWVV